jgi:hypothetical protein
MATFPSSRVLIVDPFCRQRERDAHCAMSMPAEARVGSARAGGGSHGLNRPRPAGASGSATVAGVALDEGAETGTVAAK